MCKHSHRVSRASRTEQADALKHIKNSNTRLLGGIKMNCFFNPATQTEHGFVRQFHQIWTFANSRRHCAPPTCAAAIATAA